MTTDHGSAKAPRRARIALAAGLVLALAGAAAFGYWVGRPGGLDFFGAPAPATGSPTGSPTGSATGSPTGSATATASPPAATPSLAPLANPPSKEAPPVSASLGYRVSGYRPQAIDPPFITRNEATDRQVELDGDGALVYRLGDGGDEVYQPVTTLQWAMGAHTQFWLTGQQLWLDLARASALKVLDGKTASDDAWYYPYPYKWEKAEFGYGLDPPWYSAMAQGEALSVFTQLAREYPDEAIWEQAASATFESFLQPVSADRPWVTDVVDGYVWFEEYAGPEPIEVFNGHVFALFGIYEYALATGDQRAIDLFDGGTTTALAAIEQIRLPGEVSLYCVQPQRCVEQKWQSQNYQAIHIAQLEMLAAITGDQAFNDWAAALSSDVPDPVPWRVAKYWPKP
ncbi:MAG: D-glucuronyl C5-epimerase family protein [Bifidobacteriaceae bacterium]|nr:D-glucuronyl C5-epimerase family protein [Bifidobacteriaceae bacterium]